MKLLFHGVVLLSLLISPIVVAAAPVEEVMGKYASKNYDEAIRLADDYIKSNAANRDIVGSLTFVKAISFLGKKDTAAFLNLASNFENNYPNNKYTADLISNLIGVYYRERKYEEVISVSMKYLEKYNKLHTMNRDKVDRYLVSSWMQTRKYDQVEPYVNKVLIEKPKHTQRSSLLFMDAQAALNRREYPKAHEKFSRLATADPDEGICRQSKYYVVNTAYMLGVEMVQKGEKPELVENQFKQAMDLIENFKKSGIQDKSLVAKIELREIQCDLKLKKYDSLDEAMKIALPKPEHQADRGILLYEHGESYFARAKWNKAIECYNAIDSWVQQKPANNDLMKGRQGTIDYHRVLCLMNIESPAFEQAAKQYIAQYPNTESAAKIAYQIAMIPYHQEKWAAAKTSITAFIANYPTTSEDMKNTAQYNLFNCMILGKEIDQARQLIQTSLTEMPDQTGRYGLQFLLSMTDFRRARWAEASEALCKLIEQSPEGEVAANARLYVGIAKLNYAAELKSGGEISKADQYEREARKYLIEWMKGEKPAVQGPMEAMYYQDDYAGIKEAANKFLQSKDQNELKKSQMLNWLGLVYLNQNPPDLKGACKYFEQALKNGEKSSQLFNDERVKAASWIAWIALYNNDQSQARDILKKMKSMPSSNAKLYLIDKYFYYI
ncbi:hypothetical protein LLG95_16705 [bacterium]|nr:hypothetical protein [bacterium]